MGKFRNYLLFSRAALSMVLPHQGPSSRREQISSAAELSALLGATYCCFRHQEKGKAGTFSPGDEGGLLHWH